MLAGAGVQEKTSASLQLPRGAPLRNKHTVRPLPGAEGD